MTTVEVLLSSYNGSRWLPEQVDSILGQTHTPLRLTIRDDGSTDDTRTVLSAYEADVRVQVAYGTNLGLPEAFFRLLDGSSDDADLWALSDQDDVWLADKLARAVAALAAIDGPALYCARVAVTDEELRPLYPHELPRRGPSFANALVQNIALGCTVVVNRKARDLLRHCWPEDCVMHDAWMYLVVAGAGQVIYDPTVVVKYRQHGGNSVGMGRGPASRLAGRVRRQLSVGGAGKHGRQDAELLRLHGEHLTTGHRRMLDEFLAGQRTLPGRLRAATLGPTHRQTRGSDLVLKALHVAGRV